MSARWPQKSWVYVSRSTWTCSHSSDFTACLAPQLAHAQPGRLQRALVTFVTVHQELVCLLFCAAGCCSRGRLTASTRPVFQGLHWKQSCSQVRWRETGKNACQMARCSNLYWRIPGKPSINHRVSYTVSRTFGGFPQHHHRRSGVSDKCGLQTGGWVPSKFRSDPAFSRVGFGEVLTRRKRVS